MSDDIERRLASLIMTDPTVHAVYTAGRDQGIQDVEILCNMVIALHSQLSATQDMARRLMETNSAPLVFMTEPAPE